MNHGTRQRSTTAVHPSQTATTARHRATWGGHRAAFPDGHGLQVDGASIHRRGGQKSHQNLDQRNPQARGTHRHHGHAAKSQKDHPSRETTCARSIKSLHDDPQVHHTMAKAKRKRRCRRQQSQRGGIAPLVAMALPALLAAGKAAAVGAVGSAAGYGLKKGIKTIGRKVKKIIRKRRAKKKAKRTGNPSDSSG